MRHGSGGENVSRQIAFEQPQDNQQRVSLPEAGILQAVRYLLMEPKDECSIVQIRLTERRVHGRHRGAKAMRQMQIAGRLKRD